MTAEGDDRGTLEDLAAVLRGLDGAGYGAYKRIRGGWAADGLTLRVDHVQGDPYATPSRLRLHLPPGTHGIPADAWTTRPRRIGLCDFVLRTFRSACDALPHVGGSGKSGLVLVSVESPLVVERAGCAIDGDGLTLRFRVGLPAMGRRCLGRSAATLLTEHLPAAARCLHWDGLNEETAWRWIRTTEDHAHLQGLLGERDLVGFVRDGSILPRATGVSHAPLEDAIPFPSSDLRVSLPTLHHGDVEGLGVPRGVTVVTGGGFHGKTTLLEALQEGVFPHVPGDGREWVVTAADAVKVRSEDGRAVTGVDLRPFIHGLPLGRDTEAFTSPDASGSTSLAADILEALEAGTSLLLMDEDTCATNLMVRDVRMQELVEKETITPLIDRVEKLAAAGVSALVVTGGGGDYLDVADTVILMEDYQPREVTRRAREVAAAHPTRRRTGASAHPLRHTDRAPDPASFDPRRRGRVRIRTRGSDAISFGEEDLDLSGVEQLVDHGQARAIGAMLWELERMADGRRTVRELVHAVVDRAIEEGLPAIEDSPELALPRPQEVAKALNRLRSLTLR